MLLRTAPQPTRAERLLSATKLHEILRIALDDLKVVEKDPRYSVDMDSWHTVGFADHTSSEKKCFVCLGGSVLAGSLGKPADQDYAEMIVGDPRIYRILGALNSLRVGDVSDAQYEFGGCCDANGLSRGVPDYEEPGWWPAMEQLYSDLVKEDI